MGAHLGSLSGWTTSLSHFPERGPFRDGDQLRKIAVRASGRHVRAVTVVHLIDNHVADSYSSMVQATSVKLVRREHHGASKLTSQHRLSDNAAELTCGCKTNRHACQGVKLFLEISLSNPSDRF